MNVSQDIMKMLATDICNYLKLDEDLFYCGGHVSNRVTEGRRYFCYISRDQFRVEKIFIKKFLGFANVATVDRHYANVQKGLSGYDSIQLKLDIKGIKELCKNYLDEYQKSKL